MSGTVEVLHETDHCWVVACFNADCPEHGNGTFAPPWAGEYPSRLEAEVNASEHREFIRDYWRPGGCPTCGQRVKALDTLPRGDA